MQKIDRWKLADELSIYQIVLLLAGYDPSEFEMDHNSEWPKEVKIEIAPYLNAVKNAARSKRFPANLTIYQESDELDCHNTLVEIEGFTSWLKEKNLIDGFFVGISTEASPISNPNSEFYAAKLDAAVRAWTEVTSDPGALNGKTPKKALEIWLRKHANEYGLANKDGNPNELGIEEICKVANWKPSGGASPTPTPTQQITQQPASTGRWVRPRPPPGARKPPTPKRATTFDEDIPF